MTATGFVLLLAVAMAHGAAVVRPGRIVGGFAIAQQIVPYQVSLQYQTYHICGGSIIAPRWVLTACHCTYGRPAAYFTIRAGSGLLEQGGDVIRVAKIIEHEQFDRGLYDFDFSLLELSSRIILDGKTKAVIPLPEPGRPIPDDTPLLVSGWGYTLSASESREKVRAVIVKTVNHNQCHEKYMIDGGITDQMLCAADTGKDSCNGDSGGPARNLPDGTLAGVVSFGMSCADKVFPGVYSRVSTVRPWILAKAGV